MANLLFELYIRPGAADSDAAVRNLQRLRREAGASGSVRVIDVTTDGVAAVANNILLTPTLIVRSGSRELRFIGNLTRRDRLLQMLDPEQRSPDGGW